MKEGTVPSINDVDILSLMKKKVNALFIRFVKNNFKKTSFLIKAPEHLSGLQGLPGLLSDHQVESRIWKDGDIWQLLLVNAMHDFNSTREPLLGHCIIRYNAIHDSKSSIHRISVQMKFEESAIKTRLESLLDHAIEAVEIMQTENSEVAATWAKPGESGCIKSLAKSKNKKPAASTAIIQPALSVEDFVAKVLLIFSVNFLQEECVSGNFISCTPVQIQKKIGDDTSSIYRITLRGGHFQNPFQVTVRLYHNGKNMVVLGVFNQHFVTKEELASINEGN